jgi:hypothetical protein
MNASNYIAIATAAIGLATLWKSIAEYIRQGSTKRAEQFIEMRSRLRENPVFINLCELLENDSPALRAIPLLDKDNFLGFFEELTLLWNSKVFNDETVYYMFGYYALRCHRSENFWSDLNRNQIQWSHFNDFVKRLEDIESTYRPSRRRFRL